MSIHHWGIIAPTWYVVDQFSARMERAFGPSWTLCDIHVLTLRFLDAGFVRYPMSPEIRNERRKAGEAFGLIRQAHSLGCEHIGICVDT